jgi:hypothetical protein
VTNRVERRRHELEYLRCLIHEGEGKVLPDPHGEYEDTKTEKSTHYWC